MFCVLSSQAFSIDRDSLNHAGGSYVLNTIGYGFFTKVLGANRTWGMILSSTLTLGVGLTKEMIDARNYKSNIDGKDMLFNTLGTAASDLTIFVYKFSLEWPLE